MIRMKNTLTLAVLLAPLLAYDDTHGAPMANMPHTGFQRLDAGAMTVIMDTGPPPPQLMPTPQDRGSQS